MISRDIVGGCHSLHEQLESFAGEYVIVAKLYGGDRKFSCMKKCGLGSGTILISGCMTGSIYSLIRLWSSGSSLGTGDAGGVSTIYNGCSSTFFGVD